MSSGNYKLGADAVAGWRDSMLTGERQPRWSVGPAFDSVEVGPGLVVLLGGAPGAGKTALAMQWTLDALRLDPKLRALVANVESSPAVLLDRQLARLSGVPLDRIRNRAFSEGPSEEVAQRLDLGLDQLASVAERMAFLEPPFDLGNVAAAATDFGACLLVLDYVQRFEAGKHADKRQSVNALMGYLRQFADAGIGCLMLAAVGRTKDTSGRSSYSADGLGLASFRESSELEFGCDSAYMLSRRKSTFEADLRCLKNRHAEPVDLRLRFNGALQHYERIDDSSSAPKPDITGEVSKLWDSEDAATDETEGDCQ